jgi:hypothetical protein
MFVSTFTFADVATTLRERQTNSNRRREKMKIPKLSRLEFIFDWYLASVAVWEGYKGWAFSIMSNAFGCIPYSSGYRAFFAIQVSVEDSFEDLEGNSLNHYSIDLHLLWLPKPIISDFDKAYIQAENLVGKNFIHAIWEVIKWRRIEKKEAKNVL